MESKGSAWIAVRHSKTQINALKKHGIKNSSEHVEYIQVKNLNLSNSQEVIHHKQIYKRDPQLCMQCLAPLVEIAQYIDHKPSFIK